jgi:hypothetical protein
VLRVTDGAKSPGTWTILKSKYPASLLLNICQILVGALFYFYFILFSRFYLALFC